MPRAQGNAGTRGGTARRSNPRSLLYIFFNNQNVCRCQWTNRPIINPSINSSIGRESKTRSMAQSTAPTAGHLANPPGALQLDRKYVSEILQSEMSAISSKSRVPLLEWESSKRSLLAHSVDTVLSADDRAQRISARCDALFQAAACTTNHLAKLDEVFSTFLYSHLENSELPPDAITTMVIAVLSRLTATPPAPQSLPNSLPSCYFANAPSWETLHVASFVPANLIRLVANEILRYHGIRHVLVLPHYLTEVASIISAVCDRELKQSAPEWFIVRAFLWTFWQRLNTLIRYFQCKQNLLGGFTSHGSEFDSPCLFSVCLGTRIEEVLEQNSRQGKPDNMCSWALALTRNDPLCFGLDFRLLHQRFASIFHGVKARCQPNSAQSCDGRGPNCLRYKGTKVSDQSAHDQTCTFQNASEPKLKWDESSYRRVDGGRAVSVDQGTKSDTKVRYCSASDKTLAISHVWVHGQGGRPESGINRCLHQRYCRIAQELGCDSYWMDTVSIPQDHQLRREAISKINTIFMESRAVLVCDRDFMQVDVSKVTLPLLEALLVGVLLCDWNIRAWTLLEAVKGRAKIQLLCKDNRTVDLQELLQNVCDQGRLDVAVFANPLRHMLLKHEDAFEPMIFPRKSSALERTRHLVKGQLTQGEVEMQIPIGLGGSWLSHRPASRPEDEIVIWSLLLGDLRPPLYNAEEFWRGVTNVDTGYLMSSCPRLKKTGLSWAPSTPYAMVQQPGSVTPPDRIHLPTYTSQTSIGHIQRNGLWASWYVCEFDSRNQTPAQSQDPAAREFTAILQRFHVTDRHVALLQPIHQDDRRICFGEKRREVAAQPGGFGRLVAVCESSKKKLKRQGKTDILSEPRPKSHCWLWKGVYEWPEQVPMPEFYACFQFWIG